MTEDRYILRDNDGDIRFRNKSEFKKKQNNITISKLRKDVNDLLDEIEQEMKANGKGQR